VKKSKGDTEGKKNDAERKGGESGKEKKSEKGNRSFNGGDGKGTRHTTGEAIFEAGDLAKGNGASLTGGKSDAAFGNR